MVLVHFETLCTVAQYSIPLAIMLRISIWYRFDGNIFNLRRLQAKTKAHTNVLDGFLYADDLDKNASSEAKIQTAMDQISQSCDNYDLTISTKRRRLYTNQHLYNDHCEWNKTESC